MEIGQEYLDVDLLQEYLNSLGKVVVGKMFLLYCQQSVIYLQDIERAQLNEATVDWQTHCHKMKGAAASVGMLELHKKLKSAEKSEAAQEQKLVLLNDIKITNEKSILAFKQFLNQD